jgi:hypothetical protein
LRFCALVPSILQICPAPSFFAPGWSFTRKSMSFRCYFSLSNKLLAPMDVDEKQKRLTLSHQSSKSQAKRAATTWVHSVRSSEHTVIQSISGDPYYMPSTIVLVYKSIWGITMRSIQRLGHRLHHI